MKRAFFLAAAVLAAGSGPALAHTGAAAGAAGGLAAGIAHPLGGLDHILAMLAVGMLGAQLGGRALWAVPAAFVGVMLVGGILGAMGIGLPLVEVGITGSVVVLGAVVALGRHLPLAGAMGLAGLLAVFHGHAHGAEMPAAATGLAYGAGFALATALLHAAGAGAAVGLRRIAETAAPMVLRAGGGVIAAGGLALAAT